MEKVILDSKYAKEENLTGYASIDKPWLKYYPRELLEQRKHKKQYNKILHKLKDVWTNPEEAIINYYDTEIKVKDFFNRIDEIAKSLTFLGIKEGDTIMASLESVPEFIELLLACEMVGCSIKDYIEDVESIIKLINMDSTVSYYFAPDYLDISDSNKIYNETNIKNIITIDPLFSVNNKDKLRSNIADVINSKYSKEKSEDKRNITWNKFLRKGKNINHFEENNKNNIKLFSAFTSGSTGEPKEVIHSSQSVLGIVNQLTLFPFHEKSKDTWLHTIASPIHVTVVVSMMCFPLADGKKLILDPYCRIENLDIEIMYYEPTCWGSAPICFNTLLESNRIPKDYDMSYLKMIGFGSEPLTKKYAIDIQNFLEMHNCKAQFTTSYGQSEGGSAFTTTLGKEMTLSGSYGFPYIDTTISIFEPNTTNELKYNEIGEICKSGPGIMLGYSDKELTDKVLKQHSDGKLWLHTGDYGYMTEEGLLFVLGREEIKVYPNKKVFPLKIENEISSVDGVKEAIIVSGKDKQNEGFRVPYLFVIAEKNIEKDVVLQNINSFCDKELLQEEKPVDIYFLEEKPIRKFKTDKIGLQAKYNL